MVSDLLEQQAMRAGTKRTCRLLPAFAHECVEVRLKGAVAVETPLDDERDALARVLQVGFGRDGGQTGWPSGRQIGGADRRRLPDRAREISLSALKAIRNVSGRLYRVTHPKAVEGGQRCLAGTQVNRGTLSVYTISGTLRAWMTARPS
jgi:hypothetical protein